MFSHLRTIWLTFLHLFKKKVTIEYPEEKIKLRRTGSLGLELVHTLLRQLGAKVVIAREGGTKFDIRMPYATQ